MPKNKTYVPSLDGLRAIAVGFVVCIHAGAPGFVLGWLGVDIFFAISGFLITTLLIKEYEKTDTVNVAKFWGRRFLRLMPAYWLYVASMTIWMWSGSDTLQTHGGWSPFRYTLSLWFYFNNYAPMGGIWEHQLMTVQLWSLAIEEQFYFFWPFIFFISIKRKRLPLVIFVLLIFVIIYRLLFASHFDLLNTLYARGICIFAGCGTAILFVQYPSVVRLFTHKAFLTAQLVFCAAICLICTALIYDNIITEDHVLYYVLPFLAFLFALFTASLWYGKPGFLSKCFSLPPLVYIGRISYGIYLYHLVANKLTWEIFLNKDIFGNQYLDYALRFSFYLLLSIGIASLSYHYYERWFLKLKDKLR